MKPAAEITDRAKRYRANQNQPPGPRRCNFCGDAKNIDVDHIGGDESDGDRQNLIYLCRACNTQKGIIQARHRIGIRTVQYNPARGATFAQFQKDAAVLLGIVPGNVAAATARMRATSPEKRAEYAKRIARRNPGGEITYGDYIHAVLEHQRKAHDAGGRIIHATPAYLRSEYAKRIAATKASHRST